MKSISRSAFVDVPREAASLYLAAFDDGTVKVGQSNNPRTRLNSLAYEARKRYGIAMVRWHVFAGAGGGWTTARDRFHACHVARRMEQQCIKQFTAIATVRGPGREFFTGLDFDAALRHVQDVICQQVSESTKSGGVCGTEHDVTLFFCPQEVIPNGSQLLGAQKNG